MPGEEKRLVVMEVDESSLQIEGAAMVSNMLLSHSHRIGIPN